jgi:type II secretory pathway component PulF
MLFRYITKDRRGKRFYGKIESNSEQDLEKQFREAGYSIVILESLGSKTSMNDIDPNSIQQATTRRSTSKTIPKDQKSRFIQQLSILMDSGMELRSGLGVLLEQESRSSRMAGFLQHLIQHIESGESLSDALNSIKAKFEPYETAMIRAGESIGKLPQSLTRLSDLITKSTRIRKAMISACFYPVTVLFVAAIIVFILTLFVIPRFESILSEQIGPDAMPKLTAIILGTSRWSLAHWKLIAIAALGTFFSLSFLRKWALFQRLCENVFLKIPIFKTIIVEWNIVLFSRTFGELLHCGTPLTESLRLAMEIVKSATIHQALQHVFHDLEHGITLSEALKRHHVFPPMAQGLMAVGDRSGTIGDMMNRVAENYEYQLNETIKQMTKLLEPIMIVLLAIFVSAIVIGLFLPLVALIKGFSG